MYSKIYFQNLTYGYSGYFEYNLVHLNILNKMIMTQLIVFPNFKLYQLFPKN